MTAESFYRKKIVEHDSIVFQEEEEQFIVDMIKEYAALKSRSVNDYEINEKAMKSASASYCKAQTKTVRVAWFKYGAMWMRDLLLKGGEGTNG